MTDRHYIIDRLGLDGLIDELRARGFTVVGPQVRDAAIVHDEIAGVADLPAGWTDFQDGGTYRLSRRDDEALFGFAVGPHSWKQYLFPAESLLWRARRGDDGFEVETSTEQTPRFAFIGVRACDLAAVGVQDRVFMSGTSSDSQYSQRREQAFIVAVNCGSPAGTCFCVSMGTGPRASHGFDLALTELIEDGTSRFVVDVGSDRGQEVLDSIECRAANGEEATLAEAVSEDAAAQMGRVMDTTDIRDLLSRNRQHPQWDDVGDRCLTCGNCTMVCPTCFCSTVEDTSDLSGDVAERHRIWDSCFTEDFSYVSGGSVRTSNSGRYRQWMTHKLSTWIDQFGTSGCVGCGRCITWCPVGIDITSEVRAIRATDQGLEGR
ncbi:MAG: 4Fe-4S dicluster domain-containing protein [Nocardioidaceae bacterium]